MRNQRYQRLSAAREDLDDALQAAIGEQNAATSSDAEEDDYLGSDPMATGAAGELTTANEDFTMITGASLASISFKANATMVSDGTHEEHEHAVSEHLTSSPPSQECVLYPDITEQADEARTPVPNARHDAMDWDFAEHGNAHYETEEEMEEEYDEEPVDSHHSIDEAEDEHVINSHHSMDEEEDENINDARHPMVEDDDQQIVDSHHSSVEDDTEDVNNSHHSMADNDEHPSFKPHSSSVHKNSRSSTAAHAQPRHSSPAPQHNRSVSRNLVEEETTVGAPNPANEDVDEAEAEVEDDDIWAEEASREIEDSAITTTTTRSQPFQRTRRLDRSVGSPAKPPSQLPTTRVPPKLSEQQDPPRRAKLPRTWRQTSGVDSSYADLTGPPVAATNVAPEVSQTALDQSVPELGRRASVDETGSGRSSGVLTPPSTDEDDSRRKEGDASLIKHIAAEAAKKSRRQTEEQGGNEEEQLSEHDLDEAQDHELEDEDEAEDEGEEGDISGFTNPGAGDTQLEAHHRFGRQHDRKDVDVDIASPLSESGSSVSGGEDTGFFWQNNLPQVYRSGKEKPQPQPQKRKHLDLSAILRMDSSKVEDQESSKNEISSQRAEQINHAREQASRPRPVFETHRKPTLVARQTRAEQAGSSPAGNILPSPLRRSLLRSSKALEAAPDVSSPVNENSDHSAGRTKSDVVEETHPTVADDSLAGQAHNARVRGTGSFQAHMAEETQPSITDDSLASKASDQRQLLGEFKATTPVAKKPAHERLAVLRDSPQFLRSADASYEETESTFKNSWPEHSYEEHLNVESPQKITVNFNDSTLSYQQQEEQEPKPSLLAPRRPIQPLFEKSANAPILKPPNPTSTKPNLSPGPPTITLVGNKNYNPASLPQHHENEGVFSRLSTTFWSAVARPQGPPPTPAPAARTTEQTISLSLRAQLRSRYGVLPNSHPWTMSHMRTLHRLLNSLESGRRDTIVPTHTPLPCHFEDIIDEGRQTATGRSFRFEATHAYVVQAFMLLLVTPTLYQSMENGEVEWLGDAQAAHLRGEMGGRLGSEACFKTIKPRRGAITWEWVVECLGCCVVSNVESGGVGYSRQRVVTREGTVRDVEMSIMGDGEGDGRVREWFERERGRGRV